MSEVPDYERLLDTIARTLSEVNSGICTVLLLSGDGETVDPVAVSSSVESKTCHGAPSSNRSPAGIALAT